MITFRITLSAYQLKQQYSAIICNGMLGIKYSLSENMASDQYAFCSKLPLFIYY